MVIVRICFIGFLILILASCVVPQPAPPTAAPTVTGAPTNIAATQPVDEQPEAGEEQLLVAPTLAPTATPGIIALTVAQTVGSISPNAQRFLGLTAEDWVNLAISFLVVVLALTLVTRLVIASLRGLARRSPTPYDEHFIDAIRPYIRWLLGLVALEFATTRLQFLSPAFKQWLSQVYFILIIGIIVIGLWKLVDSFSLWYREKIESQGEKEEKEAISLLLDRTARFLVIAVGLIAVLDNLGFNVSALLAALGIGGLAISLAAQDTIANMISGVIILIDQPFRVGDRIEIQELDTWGDVVGIGLRSTRIRTIDNRMVIVPNSSISNNQVVNYTFPDPRYRIQTEISVAYGSDLRQVRQVITQSLLGIEGVLQDKPVDILFLEFGESAMNLRVRWWIESYMDARRITDRVNEAIFTALDQAQIEMPAPILTVELKGKTAENKKDSS
jgi:MscS family membrane protein